MCRSAPTAGLKHLPQLLLQHKQRLRRESFALDLLMYAWGQVMLTFMLAKRSFDTKLRKAFNSNTKIATMGNLVALAAWQIIAVCLSIIENRNTKKFEHNPNIFSHYNLSLTFHSQKI